jgi:hypothetical protein
LARESGEISNDLDGVIEGLSIESALLPGRSEALRIRVLLTAASLAFRFGSADRASHYLRSAVQSTELQHWRRPYEEIAEAIAPVLEAERRRISMRGEQVIALLEELRFQPAHSAWLPDPLSARELEILQYLPTPLDQPSSARCCSSRGTP